MIKLVKARALAASRAATAPTIKAKAALTARPQP